MLGWSRLVAVLLAAAVIIGGVSSTPTFAAPESPILAFYYPWYNADDFNRSAMSDVPVAPYNSDERATVERQIREASGAGITGFITSWMGKGNRTDRNFAMLLDASRDTGFKSTIYFESGSIGSAQAAVENIRYVMDTYGSHPSFARIGGKPAIFFWAPSAIGGPDTWRAIRQQLDPNHGWHWNVETDRPAEWLGVFDGVHLFSAASWTADATSTYRGMRSKVDSVSAETGTQKYWAAGVAPGWDNTRQGSATTVSVGRSGGAYYAARWDAAIASNPDLITVTSWNEWGEGTQIEPGTAYGNLYLDITRDRAAAYRGNGVAAQQSSVSEQPLFAFDNGFKLLADQIPGIVGAALEEEHHGANGDGLQQTTSGLMVWRKADNWTAFTDGTTTWVNGPYGVQSRSNSARFDWEAQQ